MWPWTRPVKFAVLKLRNLSGRPRAAFRHRLLGMGAGGSAPKKPAARADRSGPQNRRLAGPQSFQHRVCRTHRFRGCQRFQAHLHGRSEGVSRPEREPVPSGGAQADAAFRQNRGGVGPLRRGAGHFRSARRAGTGNHLPPRGRTEPRGRADPDPPLPPRGGQPRRAGRSLGVLESDPRRGAGRNARSLRECAGQRLAALPDLELPALGPHRASINPAERSASATNCRM